jgi:hypothetical protein
MKSKVLIDLTKIKIEEMNSYWFFKILNSTRFGKHSANRIYEDNSGKIVAVRCNCSKSMYHPVHNGNEICWGIKVDGRGLNCFSKTGKEEEVYVL